MGLAGKLKIRSEEVFQVKRADIVLHRWVNHFRATSQRMEHPGLRAKLHCFGKTGFQTSPGDLRSTAFVASFTFLNILASGQPVQ